MYAMNRRILKQFGAMYSLKAELTIKNSCTPPLPGGNTHKPMLTYHSPWGAPSCRCERCRTAGPATTGLYTHTSPGPPNAPARFAEKPCHADWPDLQQDTQQGLVHRIANMSLQGVWSMGTLSWMLTLKEDNELLPIGFLFHSVNCSRVDRQFKVTWIS